MKRTKKDSPISRRALCKLRIILLDCRGAVKQNYHSALGVSSALGASAGAAGAAAGAGAA